MARKIRDGKLESRSARLKLEIKPKPYSGPSLARGIMLLYRRNKGNGTWITKAANGHGGYWTKGIGEADDYDEADGKAVLTFFEAQDRAKKLARGTDGTSSNGAPITVEGALDAYAADLKARKADEYNARRPKRHLTDALLGRPVMLLTSTELKTWRDGLDGKLAPASINRLCNALCAALELAAKGDKRRIQNHDEWRTGLEGLPDAEHPDNVVLDDDQVHAFIAAAYKHDAALGLFVEVLARTGTRPSQAARLRVQDLHNHGDRKLMMPKSGKGGGRNRSEKRLERYSFPITQALAEKLKQAAADRAPKAPLLLQADGRSWGKDPAAFYRLDIRRIVARIRLDPDKVTLYSMRHSNIERMLKANVPVRIVAALHNTSISQIERNYTPNITERTVEISRAALLD
jgi:integrase